MGSKKVDETTTLKGDVEDDEKLPEWVVKYGAPLAITFYILVAVVKTMLTKVWFGTFPQLAQSSRVAQDLPPLLGRPSLRVARRSLLDFPPYLPSPHALC